MQKGKRREGAVNAARCSAWESGDRRRRQAAEPRARARGWRPAGATAGASGAAGWRRRCCLRACRPRTRRRCARCRGRRRPSPRRRSRPDGPRPPARRQARQVMRQGAFEGSGHRARFRKPEKVRKRACCSPLPRGAASSSSAGSGRSSGSRPRSSSAEAYSARNCDTLAACSAAVKRPPARASAATCAVQKHAHAKQQSAGVTQTGARAAERRAHGAGSKWRTTHDVRTRKACLQRDAERALRLLHSAGQRVAHRAPPARARTRRGSERKMANAATSSTSRRWFALR